MALKAEYSSPSPVTNRRKEGNIAIQSPVCLGVGYIFKRVSLNFFFTTLKNEENEGHFAIGHSKLCPQFTMMVGEITVYIHEITRTIKP